MEQLIDDPRWGKGSSPKINKLIKHLPSLTIDQFRQFIIDNNIDETCALIQRLGLQEVDLRSTPFSDPNIQPMMHFVFYLRAIIRLLDSANQREKLQQLMGYKLPLFVYVGSHVGFVDWIYDSRLDMFDLFFERYGIESLFGYVEISLVLSGNIDVLDYLLAKETANTHVFKTTIVYHACVYKNIDVLDRLAAKNYSANEPTIISTPFGKTKAYPIEQAFDSNYKSTDILDRLVLMGLDLSLVNDRPSQLLRAYRCGALECFHRLLDLGARINNETDVKAYFSDDPTCEGIAVLQKAGMDLNYCSPRGTPLQMIYSAFKDTPRHEELSQTIRELGGK